MTIKFTDAITNTFVGAETSSTFADALINTFVDALIN